MDVHFLIGTFESRNFFLSNRFVTYLKIKLGGPKCIWPASHKVYEVYKPKSAKTKYLSWFIYYATQNNIYSFLADGILFLSPMALLEYLFIPK